MSERDVAEVELSKAPFVQRQLRLRTDGWREERAIDVFSLSFPVVVVVVFTVSPPPPSRAEQRRRNFPRHT